jgi:nitroreductase
MRECLQHVRNFFASIKNLLVLWHEGLLDYYRYFRFASVGKTDQRDASYFKHLESLVIRLYHVIEKGLVIPDHEFRPDFAKPMVEQLVRLLKDEPELEHIVSPKQIAAARTSLQAYVKRHADMGLSTAADIPASVLPTAAHPPQKAVRSVSMPTPEDACAFTRVITSRTSLRDFRPDQQPSSEAIEQAVDIARWTPSVCNRQTWRVHYFTGALVQKLLALQSGNRGFGHRIPALIVVTSDLRLFVDPIERYQAWIDGGMFAMSLLLALHSGGIGTVPLNWAVLNSRDNALRKAADIPPWERIIMMIGCGFPKEDAIAAGSIRRNATEILRRH